MSRVLTNDITLAYALEDTTASGFGTLPASPTWKQLEPNDISKWGAEIKTVARNPISKNRQVRKGTIVDLDSKVELKCDLTMDSLEDFIEGFAFARAYSSGVEYWRLTAVSGADVYSLSATSGPARVYAAGSGGTITGAATLIYVRGCTNSGNNGLAVVTTVTTGATPLIAATGKNTVPEVIATGQYATLEVAGVRCLAGDLDINATGNLASAVVDFTTLGLHVGQFIYIGDDGDGSSSSHTFNTAANRGFARVMGIAAHLLTLDKKATTFVAEDNSAVASGGAQIDLYFGRFIRNVTVDDTDYVARQFQFEATFPDLYAVGSGGQGYEYAKGNFCDQVTFELPLANKALSTFSFIGTDTDPPVTATGRKTGATGALQPVQTTAFNATSDVLRLRITEADETGLTTDFKDVQVKLDNNVSPEKVIGVLGARFMNNGIFNVDLTTKALFTNADVLAAIRNNTTVTMELAMQNDDGGFIMDIPSMTLGDGAKDFPLNATVTIAIKGKAFIDPVLGTSLSFSIFPFLP